VMCGMPCAVRVIVAVYVGGAAPALVTAGAIVATRETTRAPAAAQDTFRVCEVTMPD
jgi:hypothetical protein